MSLEPTWSVKVLLPLSKVWIYLVGPVIGDIIGAALYEYKFKHAK